MKSLNHFRSWHAAKEHPAKSLVKDHFQCSCNFALSTCSSLELAGCFLNNWKARRTFTKKPRFRQFRPGCGNKNSGVLTLQLLFYTGMCIETQGAISCWTNIRRLSRQHSCEAAHQHRFFSNSSSTLLGVSVWCRVTPITWKQNDKVFSDTIAFFATMIWLGFST